jgi:23S rRNA (uracil1939-C5)-methyltransferase
MTERLIIDSIGHRGDGVAETAQGPVYVPYTLPGETVDVESVPGHPDRRHLLNVLAPSPERVEAFCPHFGVCGGCAIQHWTEARYREWKRALVVEALQSAQIETAVDPLIDAHGDGRRRAVFHARRGTHDIIEVGFAALRAHTIISIDRCPVLAPGMADAIEVAWDIAECLEPLKKPLDIQMTASDTGLDIDVRGSGPIDAKRTAALARIGTMRRLARVTRHGELVVQSVLPELRVGRATVALPPGAFLQATALGETEIARLTLEHAGKAKNVIDLFSGIGPFALRLAESRTVTASDNDNEALVALARAARTPGLKPLKTLKRDLFRQPLSAPEFAPFDAVVFDPPRQGAEAQARAIASSKVPVVIAVSCNVATFARDAKILIDGGYRLTRVTPVDQFKYTAHVEIVARFER